MKNILILGLLVLSMTGCTWGVKKDDTTVPSTQVVTADKVVPGTFKAPPDTVRPTLPIDNIKQGDDMNDPAFVVKAYKASVKALQGYAEQLETILDGYRQAAKTPEAPKPIEVKQ